MATYRQYIGSYTVLTFSGNKQCDCYLRVETSTDIVKNCTMLEFYLDREGEWTASDNIKYQITLNGQEGKTKSLDDVGKSTYLTSITLDHYEDGSHDTVNIDFELYANYSDLFYTWRFHESCSLSFDVENIDRSTPQVYIKNTSADRFGKNVSAVFEFEQWDGLSASVLNVSRSTLTLKGLDYFQAVSRTKESLNADSVTVSPIPDGTYSVTAERLNNINQNTEYVFSLDSAESQDIAPLTSGKSYELEISVTSENGNTGTAVGVLRIPQRVTSFSCESNIDLVIDENETLEYSISPTNAEEQRVSFFNSDPEIAKIDEYGTVTPLSEGSCKITVIPNDDGAEPFAYKSYPDGGYYHTPNGEWIQTDKVFSKSTGLIKISETDVFVYTGRGGDGAASALWYDDSKIFISAVEYSGTIEGTSATVEIYPPENATYVRFQSFGYSESNIELNAVRYAYGAPFKGECIVTVALTQGYPTLPENVQFLTAKLFSKINIAAEFVKKELAAFGANVEEFADSSIEGNSHPVLHIREKLEATEINCRKLKAAAKAQGITVESVSETQDFNKVNSNWYFIINNWILFLNDLHNKINGG